MKSAELQEIVPRETYDERDFLRDGLRAFWHKVRYEQRLYWPKYSGIKVYTFRWWKNKKVTQQAVDQAMRRIREKRLYG